MNPKASQPWIPVERIESFVQLEPALVILGFAAGAWLVYRFFLGEISEERHRNLRNLFTNLGVHLVFATSLYLAYFGLNHAIAAESVAPGWSRLASYVGLLTVFAGATVFIKTWRILVFEYLFIGHMKAGVPVLLVNLFTLLFSIVLGGWILSEIFNIRLAPLLATSAIFSLVLGLALQETLGNLFSGVALQMDKPYEIGDWIEVHSDGLKWVGQVHEISWRATLLIAPTDENVTIPNRIMSQAKISNFSLKSRPFVRSQVFRLPYGSHPRRVKDALVRAVIGVPAIRKNPEPFAMISESTESWLLFKVIYFIDDYGSQWRIGDQVIAAAIDALEREGVTLAPPRIAVIREEPSSPKAS